MERLNALIAAAFILIAVGDAFAAAAVSDLKDRLRALDPVDVAIPNFPVRLINQGVTQGAVHVALEVSPEGSVSDYLVTAYTHPELARVTADAVRSWVFNPAQEPTGPVAHTIKLNLKFRAEATSMVLVERRLEPLADTHGDYVFAPSSLDELDARPTPRMAPAPEYPEEWEQQGITGEVAVSFYIDEAGTVRVPTVDFAAHPWLASIAMNAVRAWRFEPPTAAGKPVIVQVRQTFSFGSGSQNGINDGTR